MKKPHDEKFSAATLALALLPPLLLIACTGDDGPRGPQGPPGDAGPTDSTLERGEDPPGVVLTILALRGGTGPAGAFNAGNTISVDFTLEKADGTSWDPAELSTGRIIVSGPTFNYQRVLPEQDDLLTSAVVNADDSLTYTFATSIPANYDEPINYTGNFADGVLAGTPLLDGTYTVGMYAAWSYTVEGESKRDVGNATSDFLLGGAASLEPRAVVAQENCNQCHTSLQAHGGMRREVTLCLLCHTSGSEDADTASVAGGTPDVTIDFRVMIHKIHNGKHLPSVLGVATLDDGSRDYDAEPRPYQVIGFRDSLHDYSNVGFPVWPNLNITMPRDSGYSSLSDEAKAQEDEIRRGVTSCAVCHGDPDGSGPLQAPAQGQVAYTQPTRRACGACHDDVDWDRPYTSNDSTMPQQATDSACTQCHEVAGSALDVTDAHLHPLLDGSFDPGLHFDLAGVVERGSHDSDGTIDPGERMAIGFRVTDDAGQDVDPGDISSISLVVAGPNENSNLLLNASVPTAALTGAQPYTLTLPVTLSLEYLGDSSLGAGDDFTTSRTPLWDDRGAPATVFVHSATAGGSSILTEAVSFAQNYVDVDDATGFDRDDYAAIDMGDPSLREYLRIQFVDVTSERERLWFSSPSTPAYPTGPLKEHLAGATVEEVTLDQKVLGVDYSLDPATGEITELVDFGDGSSVVVTYTSDFVMPDVYPVPLNGSQGLDETWGEWSGKPIVDGTYRVGLWGSRALSLVLHGETNNYNGASTAVSHDFLVGSATVEEPYDLIASAETCLACHKDIWFHGGGRRGFDSCILCHGTAGSEDRPRYVAANAPDTSGLTVNFRTMLHKIHMGEELAHASSYEVIGFGQGYPNNFSSHTYEHVVFPDMPDTVMNCAKCHGEENSAWQVPADRDHPTDQGLPAREWRATCGSCHDSDDASGHIGAMTSDGQESCEVCHGEGKEWSVDLVHKVYR